jgi:hypothetical protein
VVHIAHSACQSRRRGQLLGTVGSCNFDWLSFWLNYELNLNSTKRIFVDDLRRMFFVDLRVSAAGGRASYVNSKEKPVICNSYDLI